MPAVLIIILSALGTGFFLVLALALESWLWQRDVGLSLPSLRWGGNLWDKVLSIILALAVLGALGTLAYTVASPPEVEKFTEFYILGLGGEAMDYPKELGVGEEGKVIVGIINREQETVTYSVGIAIDGVKNSEVGPVALKHEEKWEGTVSFSPKKAGDKQKVEFLLYRDGQQDVYQKLYLWVDVR